MNKVQKVLNDFVEKNLTVGASLLIYKSGREIFFGYAGKRDSNAAAHFDRDTIMLMYSMTKVVTAAAIMTLVDQKVLKPETPVYEFIPEYRDLQIIRPDGRLEPVSQPLTIHHLLTMTSGIPYPSIQPANDDNVSPYYIRAMQECKNMKELSTLEFARLIASCPLCFQPGERWLYGLSADVLGGVIVAATGMELGDYMKKILFDPLDMQDTFFHVPEEKKDRLATLYNVDENGNFYPRRETFGFADQGDIKLEMGGAGLYSTLDDFMKFGEMLRLDGKGIISKESVQLMRKNHLTPNQLATFSETDSGYGYGYLVRCLIDEKKNHEYRESLGSFGWNGMGGTTLRIDPVREMTVVFGIQRVPPKHELFIPRLMQAIADELA